MNGEPAPSAGTTVPLPQLRAFAATYADVAGPGRRWFAHSSLDAPDAPGNGVDVAGVLHAGTPSAFCGAATEAATPGLGDEACCVACMPALADPSASGLEPTSFEQIVVSAWTVLRSLQQDPVHADHIDAVTVLLRTAWMSDYVDFSPLLLELQEALASSVHTLDGRELTQLIASAAQPEPTSWQALLTPPEAADTGLATELLACDYDALAALPQTWHTRLIRTTMTLHHHWAGAVDGKVVLPVSHEAASRAHVMVPPAVLSLSPPAELSLPTLQQAAALWQPHSTGPLGDPHAAAALAADLETA